MDLNSFVNIIGLLAMVITWFIVSPLKEAISSLKFSVEKLVESLEERRKDITAIRERIAAGESKIAYNAQRINHLEELIESQCKVCNRKDD